MIVDRAPANLGDRPSCGNETVEPQTGRPTLVATGCLKAGCVRQVRAPAPAGYPIACFVCASPPRRRGGDDGTITALAPGG
jgi:hypothetical protein